MFLSTNALAQSPTVNLTIHNPSEALPIGTRLEWHSGLPISVYNIVSDPTKATPGVYYLVYNFGGGCYSQPSPLRVLATVCPSKTVNLNDAITTTNLQANLKITFHKSLPVSRQNQITDAQATSVSSGTYYAAFFDATSNCFSNPSPVVVVESNCCPSAPTLLTSNSVSICKGQSFALNASCSAGTLQWYSNSMLTGAPLTNLNVNPTQNATYYATCENTFCKSPSVSFNLSLINVIPPTVNIVSRCGAGSISFTATGCNGEIRWYSDATTKSILSISNSLTTPSLVESRSYYSACYLNSCESPRISTLAIINQEPEATFLGINPSCLGTVTQNNGLILSSKYYSTDVYSICEGSIFNSSLASAPAFIPNDGILKKNITVNTPVFFTIRVKAANGCTRDSTVSLQNLCASCPSSYCDIPIVNKAR